MERTVLKNCTLHGEVVHLILEEGKIRGISKEKGLSGVDCAGLRVIPGLIDVHAHGCIGLDTLDGNFEPMCAYLASQGTTSWLPTTMTMDPESLIEVSEKKRDFPGTQILGLHLEGPYISPKYKGAQNIAYIKAPDFEELSRVKGVKMVTLAPEWEGSEAFIRRAVEKGIVISLGHTDCDYDTAICAIDAGANCLTHTFNAMNPIHHRRPGPIGAASEKHIFAQIICDGVHIHRAVILMALKLFGTDRLTLISDAIRPAGLPDGTVSESGGLPVVVRDGAVYLKNEENTLAGSGSTLWRCVKCAVEMGIPFDDAVTMASATPARLLGVKKGKIREGYDADLLLIDEKMNIADVYIAGRRFEK